MGLRLDVAILGVVRCTPLGTVINSESTKKFLSSTFRKQRHVVERIYHHTDQYKNKIHKEFTRTADTRERENTRS